MTAQPTSLRAARHLRDGQDEPVLGSLCTGSGGLDMGVLAALGGGRIAWVADPVKERRRRLPILRQLPPAMDPRHRPRRRDDLVEFDRQIRNGSPRAIAEGKPLHGWFFVHHSFDSARPSRPRRVCVKETTPPASHRRDGRRRGRRPARLLTLSCRSGEPVTGTDTGTGTDAGRHAA